MNEMLSLLLGGAISLISVYCGTRFSKKADSEQAKLELLSSYYAEVFTAYINGVPFNTEGKITNFLIAAEKAKLFCSDESYAILEKLCISIANGKLEASNCGILLEKLRKSAKQDMNNR